MSSSFEMVVGLRQGNVLSTLLLNLCMEKVIRNVKKKTQKEQYLIGQGSAFYIQMMWQIWDMQ